MTTMGQRMKKREVEEMVLEADLGKNGLINLKGNNFSVLKATLQSQMSVCLPVSKTPQQLEIITVHHSSFIILHSSILHFATFKLFSLIIFMLSLYVCMLTKQDKLPNLNHRLFSYILIEVDES